MENFISTLHKFSLLSTKHKGGFLELFVSTRLLQGLATAMMGLFVPIFLYEISGEQFNFVATFFAATSLGYVLLLVPGMKIINRVGFSRALAFGAICSVFQYVTLFFITDTNYLMLWLPLIVATICFKIFHWVPYHVDFVAFTCGGQRGRDVSLMLAMTAFMGMVGPVFAGYVVTHSGFGVLFVISILLLAAAAVSYLFVPVVEEKFTWTYIETLRNLFSARFRNVLVGEMADGAEIIVTLVAWPIFLYEVLDANILEIGFLSSVIVLVTIVVQLIVGRYIDKVESAQKLTLKRGSILNAVGWIIKIFAFSATQIFLVGLYHNVVKIFAKTSYNAVVYDMSGEQGSYVDEFTVMREMASHTGRVIALVLMILLTMYFSIEMTFIIGAVASLLANMIYRTRNS